MKNFIAIFIFILASATAQAERLMIPVDAAMEVGFTEVQRPILHPAGPDFPETIAVPFPVRIYHVKARVSFCDYMGRDDFRLMVKELDGVNYMALYALQALSDCQRPLTTQTFIYRLADHIDTSLPFVQVGANQLAYEQKQKQVVN